MREGIVLTAAFTASVDVALAVGTVEETVTVSGRRRWLTLKPTTQRRALTAELLNELPTGRSFQNIAILVPGVQMPLIYSDVGGSDGARWQTMKVHGSRDDQMPLLMNGMPFNNMNNSGGGYNHTLAINTGTVQEMTVTTSGVDRRGHDERRRANTVAKEGGNRFTYHFYGDFSIDGLQSDNLDDALRVERAAAVDHVKELRELNPTMGGPIVTDKLWFYGGFRYLRSTKYLANSFLARIRSEVYCNNPAGCLFGYPTLGIPIGTATRVPDSRDLTRQDFSGDTYHRTYTANMTWQISAAQQGELLLPSRPAQSAQRFLDHADARSVELPVFGTGLPRARLLDEPLHEPPALRGRLHLLQRDVVVAAAGRMGIPIGKGPSSPLSATRHPRGHFTARTSSTSAPTTTSTTCALPPTT